MFHAFDASGKLVYGLLNFGAPELVNATVLKVGASGWPLACRTCYRSGSAGDYQRGRTSVSDDDLNDNVRRAVAPYKTTKE